MPADDPHSPFDVAIVGGGPAGRMAALKCALLFHTAVVLDKGPRTGRSFWVPNMDNVPGYPTGVSGKRLLDDLKKQAEHAEEVAGRRFVTWEDRVEMTRLSRGDDGVFLVEGHRVAGRSGRGEDVSFRARVVVLATGVVDRQPYIGASAEKPYDISAILPYANKGLADYCLLCDGHTVSGQRVAVLGIGKGSVAIAQTLRDHFGAREVALVSCIACATGSEHHDDERHEPVHRAADAKGVPLIEKRIDRLEGLKEGRVRLVFDDGSSEEFDKAWISLGWHKVNHDLARQMGAALDDDGYVRTTEDCEALDSDGSPISGLFVVGDLRAETWKQIPIALGDAETAIVHAYAARL